MSIGAFASDVWPLVSHWTFGPSCQQTRKGLSGGVREVGSTGVRAAAPAVAASIASTTPTAMTTRFRLRIFNLSAWPRRPDGPASTRRRSVAGTGKAATISFHRHIATARERIRGRPRAEARTFADLETGLADDVTFRRRIAPLSLMEAAAA